MAHYILCKTCSKKKYINPAANAIYCSRECRELDPEYRNKIWQRKKHNRIVGICEQCNNKYTRPRSQFYINGRKSRFCSRLCKNKHMTTLTGDRALYWKGGRIGYYGKNWIYVRDQTRQRDNNTCQMCGRTKEKNNNRDMDVHHIKPFRSFPSYLEANVLDNLISLCVGCHRKQNRK